MSLDGRPIMGWTSHGLYRYPIQNEAELDPEYTSSEGTPMDEDLEFELNYAHVAGGVPPANTERDPMLSDLALAAMRFESAHNQEDWDAIPEVVVVLNIIYQVLARRNSLRDSGLGTTRYPVWKTERLRNIDAAYDRAVLQLSYGRKKLRPPQEVVRALAFVALEATTIPAHVPSRKRRKSKYKPSKNKHRNNAEKQDPSYVPSPNDSASDGEGSESDAPVPDEVDMLNADNTANGHLSGDYESKLRILCDPFTSDPLAKAILLAKDLAVKEVEVAQLEDDWRRIKGTTLRLCLVDEVLHLRDQARRRGAGSRSPKFADWMAARKADFDAAYSKMVQELPLKQNRIALDYAPALRLCMLALQCTYMSCFDADERWPDDRHVVIELSELGSYQWFFWFYRRYKV
ncbi:uncharacterized protein LOC62_04G005366 [Vanrija pseudolonga]|uniref:Uncharacterized protein n=1 Tax=Vanrija pseudolonga TaxID=143232 RepID=A0AAF0YE49_9TREE|nr:hypothetical protein LOC62_04G005366 [Vanrija pseudolonga]